jgi:hypothetical protein
MKFKRRKEGKKERNKEERRKEIKRKVTEKERERKRINLSLPPFFYFFLSIKKGQGTLSFYRSEGNAAIVHA